MPAPWFALRRRLWDYDRVMRDPVVEEVRRIKEKLAAKFNYDIHAIAEDARARQWDSGHKVVRWDAKRGRFVEVKKPTAMSRKKALVGN